MDPVMPTERASQLLPEKGKEKFVQCDAMIADLLAELRVPLQGQVFDVVTRQPGRESKRPTAQVEEVFSSERPSVQFQQEQLIDYGDLTDGPPRLLPVLSP